MAIPYGTSRLGSLILSQTVIRRRIDVKQWEKNIELAVQKEIYKLGQEARDMARGLAPVDTGALRASIYVTRPGTPSDQENNIISKQSTIGYFRAIKVAARKNNLLELRTTNNTYSFNERTQKYLGMRQVSSYVAAEGQDSATGFVGGLRINTDSIDPNYMRMMEVRAVHIGENSHLGEQIYRGRYKNDLTTISELSGLTGLRDNLFVVVGAAVGYAGYVEYGHKNIAGHPFLTPAMDWAAKQVEDRIRRVIGPDVVIPYVN